MIPGLSVQEHSLLGIFARIDLKVRQSRKPIVVFSLLQKNERNSLSWVKKMLRIMSFVCFLEEFRTLEIAFEIYWPLAFFPEKAMVLLGAFDPPNALGALVLGNWWSLGHSLYSGPTLDYQRSPGAIVPGQCIWVLHSLPTNFRRQFIYFFYDKSEIWEILN